MSKGLRLSEKWFNRGLWLVAFVFAWFLMGLGQTLIRDLPHVEQQYNLDNFIDQQAAQPLKDKIKESQRLRSETTDALDQAQLKLNTRASDYAAARATFDNWLATRGATQQASQDDELVTRSKTLDNLKSLQRQAENEVEALRQKDLDSSQNENQVQTQLNILEDAARVKLDEVQRKQEIRVFLYRLALTLPLLLLAGWLFAKKRKTPYWPFVWGFIIFAAFAFFVELVPYLPSYGGYIRYIVGIVLTVVIGRQAIISLNNYLEKQKLAEQLPESERRETLSYDTALARLAKNVCPGCERGVDLKDVANDFCPHCGIGLHDYCKKCEARKSAFVKFCHKCGAGAIS